MRRSVLSVLLPLIVLTGACDDQKSPESILAAVPAQTVEAGTSRVALRVTVEGGDERLAFGGNGSFDFKQKRGLLTLDLGALGLPGVTGNSELRFLGDVVFMKLPFDLPQFKRRPWLRLDLTEVGKQAGVDLESLRQLQSNDPTAALNYLRGVTSGVKVVGTEKVRDVTTTHYRATLDLKKAAREVDEQLRDDIAQIAEQLGTNTIPTDVWIDEDNRLRRLRYVVDLAKVGRQAKGVPASKGSLTANFELFDFGVDVVVEAPPDDQITDLSDLVVSGEDDESERSARE